MALENVCTHAGPRDEQEETDCEQQIPRCPACTEECDATLILPCSHTMCRHCLAPGETTHSEGSVRRRVDQSVCSVLCPGCRHAVELPCWTWSSATSSLPHYPTPSPEYVSGNGGSKEGTSGDRLQRIRPQDTAQSCFRGSGAASTSVTPVRGVADLREEEMEQSVFGLRFALDPSGVPPSLHLSNSFHTVAYQDERPPSNPPEKVTRSQVASDPRALLPFPQVCADVVIARGQYYWEVDVCNSSAYRIGVTSLDRCFGWWFERQGSSFHAVYDGSAEPLCAVPPQIKALGVFLNVGGGVLSFHNPLTQEHLATLPTRFGFAGLVPALGLGHGRLRLRCGLPPPPHVFLSPNSAYRRPCGAGGGRWSREIPFRCVRNVVQKFEELAVSDSDSGLVSSFGSSCSTLASGGDL